MEQQKQDETGSKEECGLCRITYSIYSNFPPMPSAMALNAETGEWFPFDRLKSYRTGYEMAEALGTAWACDCRGRKAAQEQESKRHTHDEQYTLKDRDGKPLVNVRYRVVLDGERVKTGMTDAQGKTERIRTIFASTLRFYVTGTIRDE
ncbi:hypothetical protein OKW43_005128 [Paraburkholderia sp. WC7.3g]|uniref:hypothetical protein n=1 Tax=Paraburkholderia sp. WC7.3g TaxID=2991070 RepID=UPI003D2311F5